jgi:hypothetical protein
MKLCVCTKRNLTTEENDMNNTVEFNTVVADNLSVTVEGEYSGEDRDFGCEVTKVYITTDRAKNDILYLLSKLGKDILDSELWDVCYMDMEAQQREADECRADAKRDNMFGG